MEAWGWSAALLHGLGIVAIQLSIAIVLVSLLRIVFGRYIGRQWMTVLWWVVMVRAVAPFTVETGLWEIARPAATPVAWTAPLALDPAPVETSQEPGLTPGETAPAAATPAATTAGATQPQAAWAVTDAAVVGWACVALCMAAVRIVTYRRAVVRILAGAQTAPPHWYAVMDEARQRMKVTAWPVLLVSPDVAGPMLLGALRPKIVVPAAWAENLDRDALHYFLLHEMAHLRRGDIWFGWGWFVAQTVHWFNPLVWWAGRCVRLDRELACDEAVLASGAESDGHAYGQALLEALTRQATRGRPAAALGWAGVSEDRRFMERRITMIRDFEKGGLRGKLASAGAVCAVAAMAYCQVWAFGAEEPENTGVQAGGTSPFAEISDEQVLSAAMQAAIQEGDLIRACEAELRRVKVRDAEGNVWKDKIDLAQIAMGFEANGKPADDAERAAMIADVTAYAKAYGDDPDYAWRLWHLCGVLSKGDAEAQIEYLRKAIGAYPMVSYPQPSNHSKFQHLVNELALALWDAQGRQAAEDFVTATWKEDGRFQYFFEPVLAEKYEAEGVGDGAFAALKERMGEKPPKRELELELTPDGMAFEGQGVTMEELEEALAAIEQPLNCIVVLKPDPKAPVGRLVEAMEVLKVNGIASVGIGALSAE